ncbi:MAG: hypothetical protein WBV89_09800, partial [Ilumatobacter sp.]
MRRTTLAISIIAALSLAACGSSDNDTEPADTGAATEATDTADTTVTDETGDTTDTTADDDASEDAAPTSDEIPTTTANPDKPEVEIPAEPPTELQRTVLVEGTGDPAVAGDTVFVNYVGVRSSDAVEFDNSYDRGEPFPVV